MPCKISSAHGNKRNISQGGKGICKKNPILNFKSKFSASCNKIFVEINYFLKLFKFTTLQLKMAL